MGGFAQVAGGPVGTDASSKWYVDAGGNLKCNNNAAQVAWPGGANLSSTSAGAIVSANDIFAANVRAQNNLLGNASGPAPATQGVVIQSSSTIYSGAGAPAAGLGVNGDIYLNTTGGALTTIYQKRVGAWAGIV